MAHIDILDYKMTLLMKCFNIVLMLLLDIILPKVKKQVFFSPKLSNITHYYVFTLICNHFCMNVCFEASISTFIVYYVGILYKDHFTVVFTAVKSL